MLSSIFTTVLLATAALAHNINLGAHSRECFHEELHRDDKMTVTFQVGDREFGGAGNLDIDFWVSVERSSEPGEWRRNEGRKEGQEEVGHVHLSKLALSPL
jgi:hypothetical protein